MDEESKRQNVTIDDLKSKKYVSLKVGEKAEFTIKAFERVKCDEKFAYPAKVVGEKLDWNHEITTETGEIVTVNAWSFKDAISKAFTEAGVETPIGVKLIVDHTGIGKYDVKVVA